MDPIPGILSINTKELDDIQLSINLNRMVLKLELLHSELNALTRHFDQIREPPRVKTIT